MTEDAHLTTMGDRIKALRKEKNLSQLVVAKHLGVSVSAVSLWEKDRANITSDKLVTLAQILDCDIEWLLQGKANKNKKSEFLATDDYRSELLNMCKVEILKAPHETVEDAVHILQIAAELEGPYIQTLLKSATDLYRQQSWSRMTEEEREEFSNWMKNKEKQK